MPCIYSEADSVAVRLGPEDNNSDAAVDFLDYVSEQADYPRKIARVIESPRNRDELAAVVSLLEREYWNRQWVVQEIFNAKEIIVYCGSKKTPWKVYQLASDTFRRHKAYLDYHFPGSQRSTHNLNQYSYSQVLVSQGPGGISDIRYNAFIPGSLLEIFSACRGKVTSNPKDKLFGIVGLLPADVRADFRVNYHLDDSLSVKDIYTDIVEYLVTRREELDVMCDAIHFPVHTSSANLPSCVPDVGNGDTGLLTSFLLNDS